MKHRIIFALLAVLILGVTAVSAQSNLDPALLSLVTQAFDLTRASTSLHVETQRLVASDFGGQQQSASSWDLASGASGWNLAGSQTTTLPFGDTPTELIVQYVILDGVTYLNMDGAQMGGGFAPGGGQDTQAAAVPQGWYQLSADGTNQPQMRMAGSTDNLAPQALGGLSFPVTAESITAIAELQADAIDGQAMRVIQVTLDSQAVVNSDANALLSSGGAMMGNAPPSGDGSMPTDAQGTPIAPPSGDQGTPPDGQGQPPAMDQALDPSAVQVTFAVYIGQDDGLAHRIYSVITTTFSRDDGTQTVTTTTSIHDYSAFNAPVEITAPEITP